ncbi:hypothetical protein JAAARDRAFT_189684 [Jaapia argillacea MUCL 33604]|uniref:DRBM domain-containing protein n=1 Tax=Jaapia argillacea MUCL 33604 TaxID=933084 RepID=A0A067Q875_9AGAM|nr:hypothetical protein JAAARDRAFT_189684 [Jaapia argillacea MUCL 33604]
MSSRTTTNRTLLNNLLQETGDSGKLSWEDVEFPPKHNPEWISKVLINGVEYGEARGATKNQARENAAGRAVEAIRKDRAEKAGGK